ncbi:hypothetical protein KVR01_007413 [Diaporthe batatas]|uniref:uncharacterized protein n=1 Tax=Diaporthe batatas TaxID=748121 RepID=UPI001D05206A|nr:uncharacterized protein KVR01_007413 [Diaporthe batatas]KAG8162935.1 hypothetical protein KVR01_007413 [Diaporthe batatas]
MATTSPHYLTLDEYADLRNKQDESLRKEFSSIRNNIHNVTTNTEILKTDVKTLKTDVETLKTDVETLKTDVKTLKTDVETLKTDVKTLKTDVELLKTDVKTLKTDVELLKTDVKTLKTDVEILKTDVGTLKTDVNELRTEIRELRTEIRENRTEIRNVRTAHMNGSLKNPILPFRAPLVYDPISQKIVEPDRALFPRHAREFYALRDPSTDRLRKILIYLASFYDVHIEMDHDADESGEDTAVLGHPAQIVDLLESIFGLNEDNFIRFAERAQELDTQPSSQRKRFHTQQPTAPQPAPVRQRLDKTEPPPEHESLSSKGEVNRIKRPQPDTADNGSTTNPFSSPRDSVH